MVFGQILSLNCIPFCTPQPACFWLCMCAMQCRIDEMRQQEADFKAQMKEQCEDYKELLGEKMARDMEIAAYRSDSLV